MSFLSSVFSSSTYRSSTNDNDPLLFSSTSSSTFANPAGGERSYHKWTIYTFLTDLFYILRLSGTFTQPGRQRWVIGFCILGQMVGALLSFASQYTTATIIGDLVAGNTSSVLVSLFYAILMYVTMAILQILTAYLGEHLQLSLRTGLMQFVQDHYFQSGVPYRILNTYGNQSRSFRHHSLNRHRDETNDTEDQNEDENENEIGRQGSIDLPSSASASALPLVNPTVPDLITELASRIHARLRNERIYPMYDNTIDNDEIWTNDYKFSRLFHQKQSLLSTYDSTPKVSTIDQRLTTDISIVSTQITILLFGNYSNLAPLFGTVTYIMITFITVTSSLFINFGPVAIGLGLAFAVVCALLVTLWSYLVSRTYYRSENSFGTLRYFHSRIIQYKEEIAFLDGYRAEECSAVTLLQTYYLRTMKYYLYQGLQNTWSSFQSQYPYFLAYIVIYISIATNIETNTGGDDDDSQSMIISTGVSVIGQFIAGLVSLTDIWNTVITLGGYLARVSDVFHALQDLRTKKADDSNENGYSEIVSSSSVVQIDAEGSENGTTIVSSSSSPSVSPVLSLSSTLVDGITKLSIPLAHGHHVIIEGPSGIGKTSVLRSLAGLVTSSSSLESPLQILHTLHHQTCVCLPSKPYIPSGSLLSLFQFASVYAQHPSVASMNMFWSKHYRSLPYTMHMLRTLLSTNQVHVSSERKIIDICMQMESVRTVASSFQRYRRMGKDPCKVLDTFPFAANASGNDTPIDTSLYKEALTKMRLEHLCSYFDKEVIERSSVNDNVSSRTNNDWMTFLSLGEQQRLLLALVYVQNPRFVIFDEATSALNSELEKQCLLSLYDRGSTCIRITHRPIPYRNEERIVISDRTADENHRTSHRSNVASSSTIDNRLSVQESFGSMAKETIALLPYSSLQSSLPDSVSPSPATESSPPSSACTNLGDIWKLFKLIIYVPLFKAQSVWSPVNPSGNSTDADIAFHLSKFWKTVTHLPFIPSLLHYSLWWSRYFAYIFDYQHNIGTLLLFLISLLFCGSLSYITVQVAYIPGVMFQALLDTDLPTAGNYAVYGTVAYLGSAFIGATSRMIGQMLSLVWYARLVQYMNSVYLAQPEKLTDIHYDTDRKRYVESLPVAVSVHSILRTTVPFFYRIHTPSLAPFLSTSPAIPSLDRIDQRMLTDTQNLTVSLGTILFGGNNRLSLVQVLVTIIVTTVTLQQTYGSLPLLFGYGYAMLGIFITQRYSRRIPLIINLVTNMEGILRTQFTRIRTYSEQIGFLQFESSEAYRIHTVLASLFALLLHRIHIEFLPRLVNNTVAYGGTVIAYVIPTVIIYSLNNGTLGDNIPANVTHVTALTYLLVSLNLYVCALPDYYTNFSEAVGYIQRVGPLLELFLKIDEKIGGSTTTNIPKSKSKVTTNNADSEAINDNLIPSKLGIHGVAGINYSLSTTTVKETRTDGKNDREPPLVNPSGTQPDTLNGNEEYNYIGLCTSTVVPLHHPVSFSVENGQCVVVVGPSGIGKTSLLRVLAGLGINVDMNNNSSIDTSRGNLIAGNTKRKLYMRYTENITTTSIVTDTRINSNRGSNPSSLPRIMFIPQRPYIFSGTLIDNMIYPSPSWSNQSTISTQHDSSSSSSSTFPSSVSAIETIIYRLVRIFIVTGLYDSLIASSYLSSRYPLSSSLQSVNPHYVTDIVNSLSLYEWYTLFTSAYPWPRILSHGEQYRINLCRILYHKPQYVFMDEGFSGLPVKDSQRLLQLLCNENIGVILVTH